MTRKGFQLKQHNIPFALLLPSVNNFNYEAPLLKLKLRNIAQNKTSQKDQRTATEWKKLKGIPVFNSACKEQGSSDCLNRK